MPPVFKRKSSLYRYMFIDKQGLHILQQCQTPAPPSLRSKQRQALPIHGSMTRARRPVLHRGRVLENRNTMANTSVVANVWAFSRQSCGVLSPRIHDKHLASPRPPELRPPLPRPVRAKGQCWRSVCCLRREGIDVCTHAPVTRVHHHPSRAPLSPRGSSRGRITR